jgi:uncharacterized protein DUF6249
MFPDKFFLIFIFAIPIVAIVMGVGHAMIRTIGQQRLLELAQRERIAAIERGIDPSKLPPLPDVGNHEAYATRFGVPYQTRRAYGLLVGGIVTLAVGLGVSLMTYILEPDKRGWAAGIVPMLIGVALLVSSWVCWPRGKTGSGGC